MVPNPRKPDVVKRHLESVQKALKEREKRYEIACVYFDDETNFPTCRHGASVEEMAKEVNKAKEQLDKAEKELKQMSSLNKVGLLQFSINYGSDGSHVGPQSVVTCSSFALARV